MSLSKSIAKRLANYNDENSIGYKLRAKRAATLLQTIESTFQAQGEVRIIDIGGTQTYWKIFPAATLDRYNVSITLVNLPGAPRPQDQGRFTFAEASGCDLSLFQDNAFDNAHSNSVIEHVGDWEQMKRFASELRRVAPRHYVQTPNYWFPVEPHCMTPFFSLAA